VINRRALLVALGLVAAVSVEAQRVNVQVLSATVKDQRISGAEVLLQKNGAQSVVGYADANGNASLAPSFADDNNATVIIKKKGYSTLVAKCPCNNLTYAISPNMQNLDGMRIVLNWGAAPRDLDAHLAYGSNHIYFSSKTGSNANLDVDDVDSYGPETITIEQKNDGQEYVFAVHDFSDINSPNTYNLSQSSAKVFVYIGESLVRTYYVPTNMQGNLWTVFKLNASGEMVDINTMNRINLEADKVNTIMLHPHDAVRAAASYSTSNAQGLNALGEASYHREDYDNAIAYYQAALQEDPNYSQAYSNLGLAYKKAGRDAEAIWANRKAITLASGPTAPTVKASSLYNIGRIYEARGQYINALHQYEAAKRLKANPVYDNAIERIKREM